MTRFSILFAALLLAAGAASAQSLPGEGARCAYTDSLVTYSYDGSGFMYNILRFEFLHTFNADGTLQKDSVLMSESGEMVPYMLYEYTYTADRRLASRARCYWRKGNDGVYYWKKSSKYSYTFNAEGLVEDSIVYKVADNQWVLDYKRSYTYSDGRKDSETCLNYSNSQWVFLPL